VRLHRPARPVLTALACSAALLLVAGLAMVAQPTEATSNFGTVKIHEANTESENIVQDEPQVCTFHLHWLFFSPWASGSWHIESWPPTGDGTTVLSGTYSTGWDGSYRSPASPNTYSLPNGHYKLFWQGARDHAPKHKVFWVVCPEPTPTPTPDVTPTPPPEETPTPPPEETPTPPPEETPTPTPEETPTPTPEETPTPTPEETPTPIESFQGETATPEPTPTPVESIQGETSQPTGTPPPTGTSSRTDETTAPPLFAALICLSFGLVGLFGAQAQRRSIRRR
jgi:hypothetical protein